MSRHIFTLSRYWLRNLLFSLAGIIYVLLALVFWRVFFAPEQRTPDADYYILLIGLLGAAYSFLVTLSVASRANSAAHSTLIVRLPSRVEYLASVALSALTFATTIQVVVALLAATTGPELTLARILEIPPIWLSTNILACALALHASDLVTNGWSRVYVFSVLAVLLFTQGATETLSNLVFRLTNRLSSVAFTQGWAGVARIFNNIANWASNSGGTVLERVLGFLFWPFRAITEATQAGSFNPTQALAPAILLLYATILFMLAADFFATKDLILSE